MDPISIGLQALPMLLSLFGNRGGGQAAQQNVTTQRGPGSGPPPPPFQLGGDMMPGMGGGMGNMPLGLLPAMLGQGGGGTMAAVSPLAALLRGIH